MALGAAVSITIEYQALPAVKNMQVREHRNVVDRWIGWKNVCGFSRVDYSLKADSFDGCGTCDIT